MDNINKQLQRYGNAWGPSPANLATNVHYRVNDVNVGITLSWQPGDLAKQHDVYFGTSFADVNSATTASALYKGSRYDANGDPCNLTIADFNFKLNTNYYWRIDETNNSNVLGKASSGISKPMMARHTIQNRITDGLV